MSNRQLVTQYSSGDFVLAGLVYVYKNQKRNANNFLIHVQVGYLTLVLYVATG